MYNFDKIRKKRIIIIVLKIYFLIPNVVLVGLAVS